MYPVMQVITIFVLFQHLIHFWYIGVDLYDIATVLAKLVLFSSSIVAFQFHSFLDFCYRNYMLWRKKIVAYFKYDTKSKFPNILDNFMTH